MPLPILLATIVLIGWPAIHIATSLALRGKRERFHALVSAMRADPAYGLEEQRQVDKLVSDAKGGAEVVLLPLAVPIGLIACAIIDWSAQDLNATDEATKRLRREVAEQRALYEIASGRPDPRLLETASDPRFEAAFDLAEDLRFLRWPITLIVTLILALAAAPFFLLAYGLNVSLLKAGKAFAHRFSLAMRAGTLRYGA